MFYNSPEKILAFTKAASYLIFMNGFLGILSRRTRNKHIFLEILIRRLALTAIAARHGIGHIVFMIQVKQLNQRNTRYGLQEVL
jgi:hypothetical protein